MVTPWPRVTIHSVPITTMPKPFKPKRHSILSKSAPLPLFPRPKPQGRLQGYRVAENRRPKKRQPTASGHPPPGPPSGAREATPPRSPRLQERSATQKVANAPVPEAAIEGFQAFPARRERAATPRQFHSRNSSRQDRKRWAVTGWMQARQMVHPRTAELRRGGCSCCNERW